MPTTEALLARAEQAAEASDFDTTIALVRQAVTNDRTAALSSPWLGSWLARRYVWLFLEEALADPTLDIIIAHERDGIFDWRRRRTLVFERFVNPDLVDEAVIHDGQPEVPEFSLNDFTLLFCPGLLTGLLPDLAHASVWPRIEERYGIRVLAADSHPARSCEANVADLAAAMEHGVGHNAQSVYMSGDTATPVHGDVILMGYSKGGPDSLTFLAQRPDLAPRVRGVIGWAPAYGGSYIADDALVTASKAGDQAVDTLVELGHVAAQVVPTPIVEDLTYRLDEYRVIDSLVSLATAPRDEWWAANRSKLEALNLPFLTVSGSTSVREVPIYQMKSAKRLDEIDPDNDMQLVQEDTRLDLPTAHHLAVFHANHWDMSYDPFPQPEADTKAGKAVVKGATINTEHEFARYAAVCAFLDLFWEIGLLD